MLFGRACWHFCWHFFEWPDGALRFTRPAALFRCRFQCVPDNLTGAADRFIVRMGVHSQCDGGITVAQPLTDRDNIRTVCQGNAGGGVSELVRVEVRNAVSFPEPLLPIIQNIFPMFFSNR